jgi:hypothetical protein
VDEEVPGREYMITGPDWMLSTRDRGIEQPFFLSVERSGVETKERATQLCNQKTSRCEAGAGRHTNLGSSQQKLSLGQGSDGDETLQVSWHARTFSLEPTASEGGEARRERVCNSCKV